MKLSRQDTGLGCHFLPQGIYPGPGIEPGSPALQVDSLPSELGKPLFFFFFNRLFFRAVFGLQQNWVEGTEISPYIQLSRLSYSFLHYQHPAPEQSMCDEPALTHHSHLSSWYMAHCWWCTVVGSDKCIMIYTHHCNIIQSSDMNSVILKVLAQNIFMTIPISRNPSQGLIATSLGICL